MTECVRISECRLCDSPDLDLIYAFTPTPPGDQYLKVPRDQTCYPLDLLICRACGAVQLADTVDPALIYTDYTYTTSISPGLDAHFAKYADDVIKRIQPRLGGYVLDIGSNDGTLLRAFMKRGYMVAGVDPAKEIAKRATESGVMTYTTFFTAESARSLPLEVKPDIITANHIMANVADLHDFIDGVKLLLAPDGTFVFETGDWHAIMRRKLIDTIEHEHIHYFATRPLQRFFRRHGLELVSVENYPTKGGSLRGFVKHAPHAQDWTVASSPSNENWDALCEWRGELDALRSQLRVVLDRKPKKERWVGFGSAVGSTLLLHHFGFGEVLEALWDDNISRHGMFSPGYHLPVMPPHSIPADRVIILAWRYLDGILARHPQLRGNCLVPLPDVKAA